MDINIFQTALNAQCVNSLVKTAETMGILDPASERTKREEMDEILGFLTALEKVKISKRALFYEGLEFNTEQYLATVVGRVWVSRITCSILGPKRILPVLVDCL